MARPTKDLSDEDYVKLIAMIGIQCTRDEVCSVLGISDKTLTAALKRRGEPGGFSALYKKHLGEGRASLRRMQWKAAQSGNAAMLIWLGKQHLDQHDKQDIDHKSTDGSMSPKDVSPKVAESLAAKLLE